MWLRRSPLTGFPLLAQISRRLRMNSRAISEWRPSHFPSGTAAKFTFGLRLLGVQPGDEVFLPGAYVCGDC